MANSNKIGFEHNLIYTLVENETIKTGQDITMVTGNGSSISDKKVLQGRAKRKTITQLMMLVLIDIAKEDGDEIRQKAYWNTYYCQQMIVTSDGRSYGKYCKNRFCTLCNSIRKAELINKYFPVMSEWENPYFVTLTVKACDAKNLPRYIKKFIQGFQRISATHRKRYQRGKGRPLIGVRSLECNFNPVKRTYNPHFHIITRDRYTAEVLVDEWLNLWTSKFTNRVAQDMRPVTDLEAGLIEIIKYGSKIFTEPDMKKSLKGKSRVMVYARALDNIFKAMKRTRIFDRFGFNLPAQKTNEISSTQLLSNFEEWEYDSSKSDWINTSTGSPLANYQLPVLIESTLKDFVNLTLK